MKKFVTQLCLLLTVILAASFLLSGTMASLTGREVKIEKLYKVPLVLPSVAVVSGDSIYVTNLELKG